MHTSDIIKALPLDRGAPLPMFRQLYSQVKEAILRGTLGPGMQLPPTRELCRLLGVSRQTVLNAWDQLMAEGYLSGSVGRGTFISAHLPAVREAAPAGLGLLRPLSARGEAYAGAMAYVRYHEGKLRAFRASMPGIDLFPFDIWSRLESRRWRHPDYHLGYSDPAGYQPLRELLCVYLRASRGVNCTPDQVVITSGSQQALFLLSQLLLAPGDGVWVESPGYQGASAPLFAASARVCTVPVGPEGMDVAYAAEHYPNAKMVLATPSHQLPLGVTMSLQRRLELLRWAAANKAWIIEDDYDSEYRYTGPPLASLQSLDRAGCVVYVGTLSKVLFPGLRLGYIVAPPALVEPLVRARAVVDRHSPIVPQMAMADFMAAGHFGRHIKRTRDAYAERREALLSAIATELDDELACGPSDAGLDLCVHFRRRHDEAQVVKAALARGIELRPLSYYANRAATPACAVAPGLLLGFAAIPPAEIRHGVGVLASVLRAAR
ncbi:MocR-like pyridoxine biosynthesis transcription factor PdxR [Massilia cavernae]|uniref:PLP-dependent aminotransferase family protein n=1 Tax=Massilia cavernae TaxID=2320864 RepID=A0A418XFT2_9BURK|nr:PLP-dependent aminotransferase family protein [Massilia cavernae]RJG11316.1 PLP-dependent aminotransferase family protein [Massilia cavernae]